MPYHCASCGQTYDDARAADDNFRCPDCGSVLAAAQPAATATVPDGLPDFLALPLRDYQAETHHPLARLYRLCDFVELLTRFCTVVALGEVRARHGDGPLPADLAAQLRPEIGRPTLGSWANMLGVLLARLQRGDPLVLPELCDFAASHLLPGLRGGAGVPNPGLKEQRNRLAHGGAMPQAQAVRLLAEWGPWLKGLLARLEFLAGVDVCWYDGTAARRLAGGRRERALSNDLRKALDDRRLGRHVVLVREGRWLDLWPLCDFGPVHPPAPERGIPPRADSPLVYFRSEPTRLLYAALGADFPFSENADVLRQFQAVFRLDRAEPAAPAAPPDFEQELADEAARLVGRVEELKHAREVIKGARTGVLWVGGPGGIGKSWLLAALAERLRGDSRKDCRIAWRFRAGDAARCNRSAFFRHAVAALQKWLGKEEVSVPQDPDPLYDRLKTLLDEVAGSSAANPKSRPPRLVFVLDGLDEIDRFDAGFARVPFELERPNVVWLCAGREERALAQVFAEVKTAPGLCTHVFPGGLPPMSDADIRGLLIDTGELKYDLLKMDSEHAAADGSAEVANAAVRAVVERAAGLPLYVHFVVEDLLAGRLRFAELPTRLPLGLAAYYDDLLSRQAIGDLPSLLTPLVAAIAWARAPLEEETLRWLMVRQGLLDEDPEGRALLLQGLGAIGSMVRLAPVEGGGHGYEPYHFTFREHVREDRAGKLRWQNQRARGAFCQLATEWAAAPAGPSRRYALRFGPRTLLDGGQPEAACRLLIDLAFLEARAQAGLVFELPAEFTAVADRLPAGAPERRLLRLLGEALRRDVPALAARPGLLFQCLWNRAWWHDSPASAAHYDPPPEGWPPEGAPWQGPGPRLCELLEGWARQQSTSRAVWLRSLRPPATPLGSHEVAAFRGDDRAVWAVACSPDGRAVASAGHDGAVRVWDVTGGAELARLRSHAAAVYAVAWAPDGRTLASGDGNGAVLTWSFPWGTPPTRLPDPGGAVQALAFAPDGRRLAAALLDGTLALWDLPAGTPRRLDGHHGGAYAVAFSPDGRRVASAGGDPPVLLWDVAEGRPLALRPGFQGAVRAVAFSPDGRLLAAAGADGLIRVWDADGRERCACRGHESVIEALAFHPRLPLLASAARDRTVRLWEPDTGRERSCLRGHEHAPTAVAFVGPDGLLASSDRGGTVRLWNVECGARWGRLRGPAGPWGALHFTPQGHHLLGRSADGRVWLCPTTVPGPLTLLPGEPAPGGTVSGPDGRALAVWSGEGRLWLGRPAGSDFLWSVLADGGVDGAVFSPDGRTLLTWSREPGRPWRAHDLSAGRVVAEWAGAPGQEQVMAFAPDGSRLAAWGPGAGVELRDLRSGERLAAPQWQEALPRGLLFSPDGQRLAGWSEGRVHLGAATGDGPEVVLGEGAPTSAAVAFSPDGARLLVARGGGGAGVWDAGTGEEVARLDLRPLGGRVAEEPAAAFSPDGRRAAVRVRRDRFVLWDIDSRRCLGILSGEGDVRAVAAGQGPLLARSLPGGQVAIETAVGQPVAWFPEPLFGLVAAPATRTWAGLNGGHLHVFSLVGPAGQLTGAGEARSACVLCDGDCRGPYLGLGQGVVVGAECFARAAEAGNWGKLGTQPDAGTCLQCYRRLVQASSPLCAECMLLGLETAGQEEPLETWAVERLLAALAPAAALRWRVLLLSRFPEVLRLIEERRPAATEELRELLARQLGFEEPRLGQHVRQRALATVKSLGRQMLVSLLRLGRQTEGPLRINTTLAVGLILSGGTPDDSESAAGRGFLEEAARDPDPKVRESVALGLVSAAPDWCRPLVRSLSEDPHPDVAEVARLQLRLEDRRLA